jgi:hypothetical protein
VNDPKTEHPLARPTTIRRLWRVFSVVLAVTVLSQLVIDVKGYFSVDGWLGFGAIYGFLSCLVMVLFARVLGKALKRPVDYYREGGDDV